MLYTVLEKKIEGLTAAQKQEVLDFVNSLLSENSGTTDKKSKRQPGGLTGEFNMASDFDVTPECFNGYM